MMSARLVIFLFLILKASALISHDEGAKFSSERRKQKTDFVTFMREKMTGKDWVEFLQACNKLRKFVDKYVPKEQALKLQKFDIENLIKDVKYKDMIKNVLNGKDLVDQQVFEKLMEKEMDEEKWKKLLHWILQYESTTLFINPPPPIPAPAPLFEEPGFQIPDKLILEFLEK